MKLKSIRYTGFLIFFLCMISIFLHPATAVLFAEKALVLWFERMIPALFPFMVLSGILVRCAYGKTLSKVCYPILHPLLHINREQCACLFIGFLCGFPLGAKTIAEEYRLGYITKKEGEYLLAFCNNFGFLYMLGFVYPLLNLKMEQILIAIHFLIPFLYGLILRYTLYRKENFTESARMKNAPSSFPVALEDSMNSACLAIMKLGGYMVFFMVCNLIPLLSDKIPPLFRYFTMLFLEITSGLSETGGIFSPILLLSMTVFGGVSCMAQTYSCLQGTNLSFIKYVKHKIIQSVFAFLIYSFFFSFFYGTKVL